MIKAVFFDWFDTLARFNPPREKLQVAACQAFNIELTPETVRRGLYAADQFFYEENVRSPVGLRPPEEQEEVYSRYQGLILEQVGIEATKDLTLAVLGKVKELFQGTTFVLFDDVLPTMKRLKGRGLILGLISNIDRDMTPICRDLELDPYLDFTVTSCEVGADKPHPPIFLAALERAGVEAGEAMHVGDQYNLDVVGARGVGLKAVLLDRYNSSPKVTDCPQIGSLREIVEYL